jgi:hypothetical protein
MFVVAIMAASLQRDPVFGLKRADRFFLFVNRPVF